MGQSEVEMSTEILRNKGRLAEDKEKAGQLKLRLKGLRTAMRDQLDEFKAVEELKLDLVVEQAFEARKLQIELLEVNDEIAALNRALGR